MSDCGIFILSHCSFAMNEHESVKNHCIMGRLCECQKHNYFLFMFADCFWKKQTENHYGYFKRWRLFRLFVEQKTEL